MEKKTEWGDGCVLLNSLELTAGSLGLTIPEVPGHCALTVNSLTRVFIQQILSYTFQGTGTLVGARDKDENTPCSLLFFHFYKWVITIVAGSVKKRWKEWPHVSVGHVLISMWGVGLPQDTANKLRFEGWRGRGPTSVSRGRQGLRQGLEGPGSCRPHSSVGFIMNARSTHWEV